MKCIVVTPESTIADLETSFVTIPLYDGELGVASGHSPMIGRLGAGELRISDAGRPNESASFYVEGGFVEVLNNTVSVLTNRAIKTENLNLEEAETLLEDSLKRPANSPELMALRDRAVMQARAQRSLARRN